MTGEFVISSIAALCTVAFLLAVIFAAGIRREVMDRNTRLLLIIPLGIYVLVGVSNFLEHAGITSALDSYEDYFEILFPPFFLYFLYSWMTNRELTRRTLAEEALKKALTDVRDEKARSEAIIAAIGDGISIQDKDYRIIYQNRVHREMMGDHVGEHCYRIYRHNEQVCEGCQLAEAFRDGKVRTVARQTTTEKGIQYVEITASPLRDSSGEIIAGIEVVRNVTERTRSEEALRRSEARYSSIFKSVPISVWEEDFSEVKAALDELKRQGVEDLRKYLHEHPEFVRRAFDLTKITDVNEATLKIYGARRKEELLRSLGAVVTDESFEAAAELLIAIAEGQQYFEAETVNRTLDGKTLNILLRVTIPSDLSDFQSLLISIVDITERKRMEEELLKAQKLELVGILAGGIAHDFNNLLTAILGNIDIALLYGKPDAKVSERLMEAKKASLRAKDLTQQLLTFSTGGAPIRRLSSLGDLTRESAGFALRGAKARCEFTIPDDLWPAEIDEGQISQVINNLTVNADQAMPEGGTITIACGNVTVLKDEVPPLKEGRYIKVSITDRGIGIPREHLRNIFDPYFTTKQTGSGLGLATSLSIVKKHEGHITVESRLGTGTIFHIYLPAADGKRIQKTDDDVQLLPGKGRVLVMDDEEIVREVAGDMLRSIGYEVDFAKDGDEAIRKYQSASESGNPFDAVILDLTIPGGLGGREAVLKLREIDPNVRAIVSSGYSQDSAMSEYEAFGFRGVVAKPYTLQNLSEVLRTVTTPS